MTKLTRLADKQSKTDFSFGKSLFLVKNSCFEKLAANYVFQNSFSKIYHVLL